MLMYANLFQRKVHKINLPRVHTDIHNIHTHTHMYMHTLTHTYTYEAHAHTHIGGLARPQGRSKLEKKNSEKKLSKTGKQPHVYVKYKPISIAVMALS